MKWKLKNLVIEIFSALGVVLVRASSSYHFDAVVEMIRKGWVTCDLIRVGPSGDGGYLLPSAMKHVRSCFSPGVNYTSGFEYQLAEEFNIRCFMIDASVTGPALSHKLFTFEPLFIGNQSVDEYITLDDWVLSADISADSGLLLQMDVEGAEYETLLSVSDDNLRRFDVLAIEFHNLERLRDRSFCDYFSVIMRRLLKDFGICHIHPNSVAGSVHHRGVDVPRVMEVTLVRRDSAVFRDSETKDTLSFPHKLDETNDPRFKDLRLHEAWWQ